MSGEALGWVLRQRGGDSGMQALLILLALRCDEAGEMTPINRAYLAEVSRQSERSVSRKLGELEEAGVFVRREVYDATGGRAIAGRLNLQSSFAVATASEKAMQAAHGESDAENSGFVENMGANQVGPLWRDPESGRAKIDEGRANNDEGRAIMARPSLYEENLIKLSQSAHAGASAGERELSEKVQSGFSEFLKRYPFRAWMSVTEARRAFAGLAAPDQEAAARFAGDYAAGCAEAKRRSVKNAADWLADRDFEGLAALRQGAAEAAGLAKPQVFVADGTPARAAWDAYDLATRGRTRPTVRADSGKTGWWFDRLFPPALPPRPASAASGPPATGPPEALAEADRDGVEF